MHRQVLAACKRNHIAFLNTVSVRDVVDMIDVEDMIKRARWWAGARVKLGNRPLFHQAPDALINCGIG